MIKADVELYLRILRYEVGPAQLQAGTRPFVTELMHNCSRFRSTSWWPSAWPMGSVRRGGKTRSRSGLTSSPCALVRTRTSGADLVQGITFFTADLTGQRRRY